MNSQPWELQCDLLTAKLIFTANDVARRWKDEYVGPEHLLLAIYELQDAACLIVLANLGVTKADIYRRKREHLSSQIPISMTAKLRIACWRVRRFIQCGPQTHSKNQAFALLPLAPASERVLEHSAKRKTSLLPHGYLHIVLGLLDEKRLANLLLPQVTAEDVLKTVGQKRTGEQPL